MHARRKKHKEINQGNKALAYDKGIRAFDKKQYKNAIKCFTTALSSENANTKILYFNRGRAYFEAKKYKEAVADFEKVVDEGLGFARLYLYLGLAYFHLKKY